MEDAASLPSRDRLLDLLSIFVFCAEEKEVAAASATLRHFEQVAALWDMLEPNSILQYLSFSDMFTPYGGIAGVNKKYHQAAVHEICRQRHPSLYSVLGRDANVVEQMRRFELEGKASRSSGGVLWPSAQMSDLTTDIDILLEVKQGSNTIWHGVQPFSVGTANGNDSSCHSIDFAFQFPHYTFQAPLPERLDRFPTGRFDLGNIKEESSVQFKTVFKALYGATRLGSRRRSMPALRAHVVLRRRSTGKMVTVLSTSSPVIRGEADGKPRGNFKVDYTETIGIEFVAKISFSLHCSSEPVPENATTIAYSSQENNNPYTEVRFQFLEGFGLPRINEDLLAGITSWHWG